MEDVHFKGESEEEQIFHKTLDRIDDIQYSDLPMDWDPDIDLLESLNQIVVSFWSMDFCVFIVVHISIKL